MVLDVHTVAVRTGRLAAANPVAKLAACLLLGVGAALSGDVVTPAALLALVVPALALGGIRITHVLRRCWPLLVSAAGLGATTLIFGDSPTPWLTALTVMIRVLAVALPGVVTLQTIDPTDLADSLVQNARVPARFAYASLAALRLLPLLGTEWGIIKIARRARGVDARRSPVRRVQLFTGMVFTLLVGALRRATRLALAMDARGFDSAGPRTVARPQVVRPSDVALIVGAVVLLGLAVAVSIAFGTFHPIWA
jgi:energy-coupling factor transport system permease protein